jgi:hypothetical protein
MMGILHENQYTCLIISRSFLSRMRYVSDRILEQIKTRILCSITFFESCTVYEIMWENTVELAGRR